MVDFFKNIDTEAAARDLYKRLAKRFHPDAGGNEEIMKQINAEYKEALKRIMEGQQSVSRQSGNDTAGTTARRHAIAVSRERKKEFVRHGGKLASTAAKSLIEMLFDRYVEIKD